MSLEKRLKRLENRHPKQRTVEEMTDNELAELVTGIPGTKFDDLTNEYLQIVGCYDAVESHKEYRPVDRLER